MYEYDISFSSNKQDYILAITAMLQPVLTLLQLFLMDALHMDADYANRIRVLTTALPILISMVIVLKRNLSLTFKSYAIVFLLLMTGILIPGRWSFMKSDVLKFTLPVVVPIGLCIASVRNFAVLIRSMQFISLFAAVIGLMYAFMYLGGAFIIEGYSMTFSYALLFPTFVLITKKGYLWNSVAILLMLEMLAIGSRGALIISVAYWLFILIFGKMSFSKSILYSLFALLVYFLLFDQIIGLLASLFDSIGINSRTLDKILSNEITSSDSRDFIYDETWKLINTSPILGHGVWADRVYLDMYCHNVFLELLLDYGYLGAGLILAIFAYCQVSIFKKIPSNHKTLYIMMIGVLCPLVASSSYLISFNVGMFLGFTYSLSQMYNRQEYQDFSINNSLY